MMKKIVSIVLWQTVYEKCLLSLTTQINTQIFFLKKMTNRPKLHFLNSNEHDQVTTRK